MMDFPRCWIVPAALKPALTRSGWVFLRDKRASVAFETSQGTAALCLCSARSQPRQCEAPSDLVRSV